MVLSTNKLLRIYKFWGRYFPQVNAQIHFFFTDSCENNKIFKPPEIRK